MALSKKRGWRTPKWYFMNTEDYDKP